MCNKQVNMIGMESNMHMWHFSQISWPLWDCKKKTTWIQMTVTVSCRHARGLVGHLSHSSRHTRETPPSLVNFEAGPLVLNLKLTCRLSFLSSNFRLTVRSLERCFYDRCISLAQTSRDFIRLQHATSLLVKILPGRREAVFQIDFSSE